MAKKSQNLQASRIASTGLLAAHAMTLMKGDRVTDYLPAAQIAPTSAFEAAIGSLGNQLDLLDTSVRFLSERTTAARTGINPIEVAPSTTTGVELIDRIDAIEKRVVWARMAIESINSALVF